MCAYTWHVACGYEYAWLSVCVQVCMCKQACMFTRVPVCVYTTHRGHSPCVICLASSSLSLAHQARISPKMGPDSSGLCLPG